jgi:hypothetical protein
MSSRLCANASALAVLLLCLAQAAHAATLYGDANQDGTFALGDINTLVDWILMRTAKPSSGSQAFINADVNGSGTVDLQDLNFFVDRLLMRITKFPVETGTATLKGTIQRTVASKPVFSKVGEMLPGPPTTGPVAGAHVAILGTNLSATTDADGSFKVLNVPPGTYKILVEADTNADGVPDLIYLQQATFTVGDTVDLGTILLTVPGAIQGVAAKAFQMTGNLGILVSIPNTTYVAVTNDLGQFTMSGVPPGTYSLKATYSGYQTAGLDNVVVSSGQTTTGIMMNLAAGGSTGTLSGNVKCLGATDHTGTTITVLGLSSGSTAQTSADGSFVLAGVKVGVYQVTASRAGFQTFTFDMVPVMEGQTTALASVTLSTGAEGLANGSIQGIALLSGTTDNTGIIVWVQGTAFTTSTVSTGHYMVPVVPPGTYTLTISAPGYLSQTVTGVQVTAGGAGNAGVTTLAPGFAPTAEAGVNQSIRLPTSTLVLSGSGIAGGVDTIVGYTWEQLSGPTTSTIANPAGPSTAVTGLSAAGVYVYQLTVTSSNAGTGAVLATVTVEAANQPPVVSLGADQNLMLPTTSALLSATASDPDGFVVSVQWAQVSGPAAAAIATPAGLATSITGMTATGAYVFRFTATDNEGAAAFSDVIVNVTATANQPPAVNAGLDQAIMLPTSSVALFGTATDANGSVVSMQWTRVSGPAAVTIASPGSLNTNVTGLTAAGVYVFQLSATDDQGATSTSAMRVTVRVQVNIPPVANAGQNQTITLPASSATLSGIGTDSDGTVVAYAWTQLSGPATAAISIPLAPTTTVSGMGVKGTYVFRLTVTDNGGATGMAGVSLTVQPPDVPPTATVGLDQTIALPTNSATVSGYGYDSDGTVVSRVWVQVSGPVTAIIAQPKWSTTDVTGLTAAGTYCFRFIVTDNGGATGSADTRVCVLPVQNVPPQVDAGANQWVMLPATTATVSGTAVDTGGWIANCAWSQVSGPAAATISSPLALRTAVTGLTSAGVYKFRLSATDNSGAMAADDLVVTVYPEGPSATSWSATSDNLTGFPSAGSLTLNYVCTDFIPLCSGQVIMGNTAANTLDTINVVTGQIVGRIQLAATPARLAMDWQNQVLYVALSGATMIARVDHLNGDAVTYFPAGGTALDLSVGNGGDLFASFSAWPQTKISLIEGPAGLVKKSWIAYIGSSLAYDRAGDQLFDVSTGNSITMQQYRYNHTAHDLTLVQSCSTARGLWQPVVSFDSLHVAGLGIGGSGPPYGVSDCNPSDLTQSYGTWSKDLDNGAFSLDGKYFVGVDFSNIFVFDVATHSLLQQGIAYGWDRNRAGVSRGSRIAYGISAGSVVTNCQLVWMVMP